MAKNRAGDWRDDPRARAWAAEVAFALENLPRRPRAVVRRKVEPSRSWLLGLCLFAGLTAVCGGLELAWNSDGSLARLPLSLLDDTPFRTFLVPGLLLAVVVGGINTLAGVLVLRRHPRANAEAMVAGVVLVAWIAIEMLLLRRVHWLHGLYMSLGLGILGIGAARERRAGKLGDTVADVLRVGLHAVVGWALCWGAAMVTSSIGGAFGRVLFLRMSAYAFVFVAISASYFRSDRAWAPLRTASLFAALVGLLDLVVVACFVQRSLAVFHDPSASWAQAAIAFTASLATGVLSTRGRRPRHLISAYGG
jgi:hypothetical protein